MRNEEVATVLSFLNSAWPRSPIGKETMAVWGAELSKHDFRPVMALLKQLATTEEWRPSLAEIVRPMLRSDRKSTYAAFETVWSQISKRPHEVNDIEERAVQMLGGWSALGNWKIDDRHWHAKQFASVYEELVAEERTDTTRKLASGQHQLQEPGGMKR